MGTHDIDVDVRTALLANSVHEIRTPVQTVIGTLELLSDTELNDEQSEYLRQIQFSSNILLSLINDILDFSKIQSRQFKLESIAFDIINLTEQVADFVSIEAFNKKLEVVTDVDYSLPRYYMGDPTRLQEILINLIKNAVKFTSSGYIHIELKKSPENDRLLFEITDSGIGIPEEKRKKLFTDYYQVDASTTRKYGGTGLGLAICKNLVEAMKGEIGIKTNPYGGSIFWFTLPLTPAAESQIAQTEERNIPSHSDDFLVAPETHILIVDDSQLALQSMKNKLESFGLTNVELAENAQEALMMLNYAAQIGKPFQIAFIDMIMSRVDGWHLAAEINEQPVLRGLKRYLLVPEGQMGAEAKMKLMKWFIGYLYKPIKREKLRTLLNETYDVPTDVEPIDIVPTTSVQKFDSSIAQGLHILIADDHPTNRKLLAQFIQKFGGTTYEAEDGEDAIKQIDEHHEISLVFMDIQMLRMDGIATTKILREKKYNGIIIACTANNNDSDFKKYTEAGMNDILIKPFKRSDVQSLIEKWKVALMLPAIPASENSTNILSPSNEQPYREDNAPLWSEADFEVTISGNSEFGIQLLDDYRRQTKYLLNTAAQAIYDFDITELRRIGHTIEGSSGAISAYLLAINGKFFNRQAKTKDINKIKKAYVITRKNFLKFELLAEEWKKEHEHNKN